MFCENYFVDDDGKCDGGCNNNGDDTYGLAQFHELVSFKMSIVCLKVSMVTI